MKNLDGFIVDSPNCAKEEKDNPKKMDENHPICEKFIDHYSPTLTTAFLAIS